MRHLRSLAAPAALLGAALLLASAAPSPARGERSRGEGVGSGKGKAGKDKGDFVNLGDLNAEVTVLNVLHTLQPTPAQYAALLKASAKTMQQPPPRKRVQVSERFRKTLQELRDALVQDNGEKIDELFTRLDELRQKEDPEFDDVEITDAAREQAPRLLRLFSARQVAAYIGSVADFPDPLERLREAFEEARKLRGKEWQNVRDDAAYQVGWLVGGLDEKAEEKVREQATALLNKAHTLGEKASQEQRGELEKEARRIVGKLGPTDILKNFMERVLSETLSNHRLAAAVEALTKK